MDVWLLNYIKKHINRYSAKYIIGHVKVITDDKMALFGIIIIPLLNYIDSKSV